MPSGYVLGNSGPFYNDLPMIGSQPDVSGSTYYVNYNMGVDSNSGKSWNKPFKNIQKAIDVSNAEITNASKSAKRNTIFVLNCPSVVNLTTFPTQCDVIGRGSVSYNKLPLFTGQQAPTFGQGVRFFNIWFQNTVVSGATMSLSGSVSGCEFYGCVFDVGSASYGIIVNNSASTVIDNCKVTGLSGAASIYLGPGNIQGSYVRDCEIRGSQNYGIYIDASTTSGMVIENNRIRSYKACINDVSNKSTILNNNCISGSAKGIAGAGAIVCNLALAQDNTISCTDLKNAEFPALGTL